MFFMVSRIIKSEISVILISAKVSQTLIIFCWRGVWGDFHVKRLGIPIVTFKGEQKVDIGFIMGIQDKTPPFLSSHLLGLHLRKKHDVCLEVESFRGQIKPGLTFQIFQ